MNRLFFDTSALVKRYYEEPGTETVDTLIEGESTVVISSLAVGQRPYPTSLGLATSFIEGGACQ